MAGGRHPCSLPLILGSVDYKMLLLKGCGLEKMLTTCTVAVSIASLVCTMFLTDLTLSLP